MPVWAGRGNRRCVGPAARVPADDARVRRPASLPGSIPQSAGEEGPLAMAFLQATRRRLVRPRRSAAADWANAWRVPADRHASCPGLEVLSDASHMLSDLSATIMESTARENRRIPGTSCATGSAKPYQVIRRLISKRLPCPCIQPRLVQKRRVETGGRAAHRTRRAPREIISKPDGRTIQSVREAGGADRAVVRTQALVPARARGRARYPPRRSNRPRLKQPSAHMAQCRRSRASTRNAGARVHARDGLAISFRIEAIDYPRDPESKTPRTGRGV